MGKSGEIKKPAPAEAPKAAAPSHSPSPSPSPSRGGGVGAKLGCNAAGCKEKDVRHSFCAEHFRQFKFGLITKTGERVLDYERKIEHYQNWLRSIGERSVG